MAKMSSAAAAAWSEALAPKPFWLIEHAASDMLSPYFYTGTDKDPPWSVEKARAKRFTSKDAAWDYVHVNLIVDLCRVRLHH